MALFGLGDGLRLGGQILGAFQGDPYEDVRDEGINELRGFASGSRQPFNPMVLQRKRLLAMQPALGRLGAGFDRRFGYDSGMGYKYLAQNAIRDMDNDFADDYRTNELERYRGRLGAASTLAGMRG